MKALLSIALILVALLAAAPCRAESGMLHAQGMTVVDAAGNPVLLRCVNLSPWLNPEPYLLGRAAKAYTFSPNELREKLAAVAGADAARGFWQAWENSFVTEEDFARLHDQGFNCVRLPLDYRRISSLSPDGAVTLNDAGLAPVDHAASWGAAHGIYVMIDLHAAPGGQNTFSTVSGVPSTDTTAQLWSGTNAARNQQYTVNIWRLLARRYAGEAGIGGYDLLNEPALPRGTPANALTGLYDAITAAIRAEDMQHMIILEGNGYDRDFSAFAPPADANVMYEFHEYALFNPAWRKPSQKALQPFLDLRDKMKRPLWLGEFGEDKAPWITAMVQLMKANDIGWAVWPWKRIDTQIGNPVIETVDLPASWEKLFKYLVGTWFSKKPTADAARQAMTDMLQAIRTENCIEDKAIAATLSGQ